MHIPDGYLGPQTCIPTWLAMAPIWAAAAAKLRRELRLRQVPLLALGAAFSFVIMMFNVPIPGGTTGHAVGAVLVAVLLGPWAAVIAVSLALAVQALIFADGGITVFAANCLTMAVIMPFTGWGVYRLFGGHTATAPGRRLFAGAAAGYIGLNVAAFVTAVLFGLQPVLSHDAAGLALNSPFSLGIAVPIMAGEHLLVFGWVEALVTGLALVYLQRAMPELLPKAAPVAPMQLWKRVAVTLLVLALLSPLGLFLPGVFKAGDAWGEWAPEDLPARMQEHGMAQGYIPRQLERLSSFWHAPLPDYALPGRESTPLLTVGYIISGLLGMGLIVLLIVLARRLLTRKEPDGLASGVDASGGG